MSAGLLADPEELAGWLKAPADDGRLLAALRAASRRFRGAVRHPVAQVSGDLVLLDGDGSSTLLLPAAPVTAVASVAVDGDELDPSAYRWGRSGVLRLVRGCWPDLAAVEVVYDHGYAPIPEDIQEAVIDQARAMWRITPGVTQVTVGGETVQFGAAASVGVTAQWTTTVEKYQLNRGDRS